MLGLTCSAGCGLPILDPSLPRAGGYLPDFLRPDLRDETVPRGWPGQLTRVDTPDTDGVLAPHSFAANVSGSCSAC
jgi:hypothetical protein